MSNERGCLLRRSPDVSALLNNARASIQIRTTAKLLQSGHNFWERDEFKKKKRGEKLELWIQMIGFKIFECFIVVQMSCASWLSGRLSCRGYVPQLGGQCRLVQMNTSCHWTWLRSFSILIKMHSRVLTFHPVSMSSAPPSPSETESRVTARLLHRKCK